MDDAEIRKRKTCLVGPTCAFAVYELPPGWLPTEAEAARLIAKFEAEIGLKVAIIPHGANLKVLPNGGVYHRERLADYEVEAIARTEQGLRERLALGAPPAPEGGK